jgi:hypothetical protein
MSGERKMPHSSYRTTLHIIQTRVNASSSIAVTFGTGMSVSTWWPCKAALAIYVSVDQNGKRRVL